MVLRPLVLVHDRLDSFPSVLPKHLLVHLPSIPMFLLSLQRLVFVYSLFSTVFLSCFV